jgi:hypothetical protein
MNLSSITKLYLSILLIILVPRSIQAQSFASGFGVGGFMSSAQYKDSAKNRYTTNTRLGGRVYWMGRVTLEGNLSFAPEVGYSLKGFRVKNPAPGIQEQEVILHYIEFKFIQEYSFKEKYYFKLGPSISVAVAGRDKQLSSTNVRSNQPLPFNFAAWGRFEGAVNFAVGSHFPNGWIAEIGLTKGFSNIWDGDNGPNVKNYLFGVNIGKFIK